MKHKFFLLLLLFTGMSIISKGQKLQETVQDSIPDGLQIITNPVLDELTVKNTGTDFYEYLIYTMNGKQVKQGWFLNTIPVKRLSPGTYILFIDRKDKNIKQEFIKLADNERI